MAEISLAAPGGYTEAPRSACTFESAYAENGAMVLRALGRYGVEPSAVEDCAQEVFLVAVKRWEERASATLLRAWLLSIARNVARHYCRKRGRTERRERASEVHERPAQDLEVRVEVRDALRFFDAFLATLSEAQREVFILSQVEGLTAPEIEAALGVPRATVYTRVSRVRHAFTEAVANRDGARSDHKDKP